MDGIRRCRQRRTGCKLRAPIHRDAEGILLVEVDRRRDRGNRSDNDVERTPHYRYGMGFRKDLGAAGVVQLDGKCVVTVRNGIPGGGDKKSLIADLARHLCEQ
jgi:hypothetical protein